MSSEPEYLVEWKTTTRYLTGSESTVQCIRVNSMEEAREVATNIREEMQYIDVSLGIIWNQVDYINAYPLNTPVEI